MKTKCYIYLRCRLCASLLVLSGFAGAGCGRREPTGPPVKAPEAGERAAFLAVGRQGYGGSANWQVAESMEQVARQRGDVNFILSLGDNFHPTGVSSVDDWQWRDKFEWLYGGAHLRGMPIFAVAGNHDHQGSIEAELAYSKERLGSGRWTMDGLYYSRDFGEAGGRPLLRIVFLDSITLTGLNTEGGFPRDKITRDAQIRFLREAFGPQAESPHWRIVASHYPVRTLTQLAYQAQRAMKVILPVLNELQVDLCLSSNDYFQQILDLPGEPLHVGTNGGGGKLEEISPVDTPTQVAVSQRGFALVEVDPQKLTVELFDDDGKLTHQRTRARVKEADTGQQN